MIRGPGKPAPAALAESHLIIAGNGCPVAFSNSQAAGFNGPQRRLSHEIGQ